jgi:hypothetical protein
MEKRKLIASISVGFAAAFFFWYPISDGDVFWHLAAGREIIRTLAVPHADPFAFTSGDLRWIDLHWVFQLGMLGMHALFGLNGVRIANSVLPGLAAGLLFSLYAPAKGKLFHASLWIAALFEIRYLAPHRPIMVSLLLSAAFICCLELYGRRNRLGYLACLFPLQWLWTNTQPLFLLGPAIVLAWLTAEITRAFLPGGAERQAALRRISPLAGALPLLCLVSLANPYGTKAFRLAFLLFDRTRADGNPFSLLIDENRPLTRLFGTADSHYAWATLAMIALACVPMAIKPRAIRLPLAFVALGMGYLAFRAERNIILFFFSVLPLVSAQLPAAYASLTEGRPALLRCLGTPALIAMASLAVCSLAVHALASAQIRGSGPVAPFSFPDGSVAYLTEHPIAGNGFNADRHGGYLLWERYPPHKVFIDTRYALRPDPFLAEYCALLDDPASFRAVRDRYGITYAVLPTALAPRYDRLAAALLDDPDWRLVYADGAEALFYESGAAGGASLDLDDTLAVGSMLRDIRSRWGYNRSLEAEAAGYLAGFLERMGRKANADYVHRRMDAWR